MNYYETLYIVHPALEAGRLKDIITNIEDSLKKLGGEPLAIELWGKRKLSYFIDKQKYGTYILLQYNGKENCTNNFSVELGHNPNILAYLTTKIDSSDVIEMEEDIDTQIAGKTRDVEKPSDRSNESSDDKNNIEKIKAEENSAQVSEEKNIIEDDVKSEKLETSKEEIKEDSEQLNKEEVDKESTNKIEE